MQPTKQARNKSHQVLNEHTLISAAYSMEGGLLHAIS